MSVSQTSASMPVALRIAIASRRISALPSRGSSGASASMNQPIARPCRSGSSRVVDLEREPQHGPLLRLGLEHHREEPLDGLVEPRRRVVAGSSGSSDVVVISGCAAISSAVWLGK